MARREKTGPQTVGSSQVALTTDPVLSKTFPASGVTYGTYREMRKDPTIALARWLTVAPVLASPWSIEAEEGAPSGAQDFINEVMTPFRIHILRTAFYGNLDYGWQGYEKIFSLRSDGKVVLRKLKPLLQDLTDILVVPKTGAFAGLLQDFDTRLRLPSALLISLDVEGTDWYGQPLMENVRNAYNGWNAVNDAANRYDEKVAGANLVIEYPPGTSEVNGTETDNFEVAQGVIRSMESSGAVAIPRRVEAVSDDLNADSPNAWSIEVLSDGSPKQYSFTNRLGYIDSLKVRGLGLPERSVLEGQHGTKAEAEAHADFAITNMELRHKLCVQHVNWHLVNQLLRINYGKESENTVYIEPAPITDNALQYLRQVYADILKNPDAFLTEIDTIDLEALKDRVNIPVSPNQNTDEPGFVSDVRPKPAEDESEQ